MGLFDKIFKKGEPPGTPQGFFKTLTAYQPVFTSYSGGIYESELVRAAINARATHISKLQVEVKGSAKPKLKTRLKNRPNDFQTWGQFLYRLSTILDVQNTAFIVPVIAEYDEITGYIPVLPSRCEVLQYSGEPWIRYTFSNGQKASVELSKCGVMTKFQYQDDFFGDNNRALMPTMELVNIQNQGIAESVKGAATYRFMGTMSNFSNAEDLTKERKRFTKENFESEGGGLLLFPNTYTNVQQIKSTPFVVDADQMKLIKDNVYTYFGVNEDVLQNKTYGDAWSAFYEGAIEPFAIQFGEVLTQAAFTPFEQSNGSFVMATANRLQYMSNTDKLNVSSQMLDRGILSLNEVREIWNLPSVEGGDVRIIRGEYYNADQKTEGTEVKENE